MTDPSQQPREERNQIVGPRCLTCGGRASERIPVQDSGELCTDPIHDRCGRCGAVPADLLGNGSTLCEDCQMNDAYEAMDPGERAQICPEPLRAAPGPPQQRDHPARYVPESRVQELERERDEARRQLEVVQRNHADRVGDWARETKARKTAESHLARLEEALKAIRSHTLAPDPVREIARSALTHSTPEEQDGG